MRGAPPAESKAPEVRIQSRRGEREPALRITSVRLENRLLGPGYDFDEGAFAPITEQMLDHFARKDGPIRRPPAGF